MLQSLQMKYISGDQWIPQINLFRNNFQIMFHALCIYAAHIASSLIYFQASLLVFMAVMIQKV